MYLHSRGSDSPPAAGIPWYGRIVQSWSVTIMGIHLNRSWKYDFTTATKSKT